ncbi:MAG: fumarate hydratase [Cytophagaceae bacterium]|nr:fumarate hydratase [Cytophagaceae bacterium]|tara:strand:- start:2666 stop:3379 length:714 start_codon:yes stop_codon:yes gene_type:complete
MRFISKNAYICSVKYKAVISGDIIAYTSLEDTSKAILENGLKDVFNELEGQFNTYSRLVKGDYLECVAPVSSNSLRVALIIKTFIKSLQLTAQNKRHRYFEEHGLRMAIGFEELSRYDPEAGIIDGEAIYLSGRLVSEASTHYKKRVIIKGTLMFISNDKSLDDNINTIFSLLDHLFSKTTKKQSEVIYHKLWGLSEDEIARKLGTSQSSVNQHSTAAGWNAIEKAILYYETLLSNY